MHLLHKLELFFQASHYHGFTAGWNYWCISPLSNIASSETIRASLQIRSLLILSWFLQFFCVNTCEFNNRIFCKIPKAKTKVCIVWCLLYVHICMYECICVCVCLYVYDLCIYIYVHILWCMYMMSKYVYDFLMCLYSYILSYGFIKQLSC